MNLKNFMNICGMVRFRPMIYCADGFKMSVQAHEITYSIPNGIIGKDFQAMEIWLPFGTEELLLPFLVDPAESIFGFVPIDIIESVVDKHGGIDYEKTFTFN